MLKILNIIGSLCLASSPCLALSNMKPKTENHQIIKTIKTTSNVDNDITTFAWSMWSLRWRITLSNSSYNGFTGYLNQIDYQPTWHHQDNGYAYFFFQWLDDDNFGGAFPGLNSYTQHGFFHWPFKSNDCLVHHMGNFGPSEGQTAVAFNMIYWINNSFLVNAANAYKSTPNVQGIQFLFNFAFDGVSIFSDKGHSYKILT